MSFLLGATSTQSAEEDNSGKGEFECFKKEAQLHHDENALVWWKTNQERFLVIAKVAHQLCMSLQHQCHQGESFLLLDWL